MTELPDRLLRGALEDTASATLSAACLDAATLAAWADGTMNATDRAAVEAHAAGCARCLSLLAAMTRTEPPRAERPRWRAGFVWVPLATIAAALVIVRFALLVPVSPVPLPVRSSEAAADLPSPRALTAPHADAPLERSAAAAPPASRTVRQRERSVRNAEPPPALAKAQPAPAPSAAPAQAAAQPAPGQAAPAEAAIQAAPAQAAPTQPVPSQPSPVQSATPIVAAPPSMRDEMARTQDDVRAFTARSALKAVAESVPARVPIVIASPDRHSEWRVVGSAIEHTTDGRATWQAQSVPVTTPIRAGAAPDARVCWLVGAAGVVLRTTDGTTWTRIPFPEPADLIAVQAIDAAHASVTTADGRRFVTSDGGATWIRQ